MDTSDPWVHYSFTYIYAYKDNFTGWYMTEAHLVKSFVIILFCPVAMNLRFVLLCCRSQSP